MPAENPYVEMEVPSSIDPSLTDDDRWIATMFTQYGPTEHEQWPEGVREKYADTCIAQHRPSSPRTCPGAIVEREVLAPPDLEDIFGLVDGSIFQGEQDIAQMAFMRPTPGLAQYATPLDGLYLCGAGTHPGGGVMAASGHNAAQRILKDRRRAGGLRGRLAARRRPPALSRSGTGGARRRYPGRVLPFALSNGEVIIVVVLLVAADRRDRVRGRRAPSTARSARAPSRWTTTSRARGPTSARR